MDLRGSLSGKIWLREAECRRYVCQMLILSLCTTAQAFYAVSEWLPTPDFAFHGDPGVEINSMAVGDFDADGYDDVVWTAHGGDWLPGLGVSILRGSAYGLVGAPEPIPIDVLETGHLCTVVATDLTGDGIDDLVVGVPGPTDIVWPGEILVFAGSPAGLPATPSVRVMGGPDVRNLGQQIRAAGDIDGDGRADLLVEHEFYTVWSWMRGTGTDLEMHDEWEVGGEAYAADLDGDGDADVLHDLPAQGVFEIYQGGPDGLSSSPFWALEVSYPAFGFADLTGDGNPDLGVRPALEPSIRWFSFSDALPTDPVLVTAAPPNGSIDGLGDLDGDGFDEWALANLDFQLGLFSASEPDTIQESFVLVSPWTDGTLEASTLAGDFDGDGCRDLVVRSVASWVLDVSTNPYGGFPLVDAEIDREIASFSCPLSALGTGGSTTSLPPADSGVEQPDASNAASPDRAPASDQGCGCATGDRALGWGLGVFLLALVQRRVAPALGCRSV